ISSNRAVFQTLPTLPGLGTLNYSASAASVDGNVIAGTAHSNTVGNVPFRWSASTGIQRLTSDSLGGIAMDISDDGTTVVGEYYPQPAGSTGFNGFRWTSQNGLQDLG